MRLAPVGLLVTLVALFAIAGCSGDNDDGASRDREAIEHAIRFAATSGDPRACTEAETQKFLNQNADHPGKAAVRQCRRDAANNPATSVTVQDAHIDGSSATADAAVKGSVYDGQTVTFRLRKIGDAWKLDETTGFAVFDRAAANASFIGAVKSDPQTPANSELPQPALPSAQ